MEGYGGKGKHYSIWIRTNKCIEIEAGHSHGAERVVQSILKVITITVIIIIIAT